MCFLRQTYVTSHIQHICVTYDILMFNFIFWKIKTYTDMFQKRQPYVFSHMGLTYASRFIRDTYVQNVTHMWPHMWHIWVLMFAIWDTYTFFVCHIYVTYHMCAIWMTYVVHIVTYVPLMWYICDNMCHICHMWRHICDT